MDSRSVLNNVIGTLIPAVILHTELFKQQCIVGRNHDICTSTYRKKNYGKLITDRYI